MIIIITTLCWLCQKSIKIDNYKYNNSKNKRFFCDKICYKEWQNTSEYAETRKNISCSKVPDVNLNCEYCNKGFTRSSRNVKGNIHFCCKECRNKHNSEKILREMVKDEIKVNCDHCKKIKYVTEYKYKKNKYHFCSLECYWEWRKVNIPKGKESPYYNRIETHCYKCNQKIFVIPFVIERNKYNFCSQQCYWQWYMHERKLIDLNTKPQLILNDLLDDLNIKYENEYNYDSFFIDNCLIVNDKLFFVECNGTFWHTDNRKFDGIYHKFQLKGILRDKKKNKKIKMAFNTNILYLWEEDLINNGDLCKKLILEYVNNNGVLNNYHSFNYDLKDNILIIKKDRIIPYMDYSMEELNLLIKYIS